MTTDERLAQELDQAEAKAWDSLSRYKFQMFGYWAAIWVHLNRVGNLKRPNPFRDLVKAARPREMNLAAERIEGALEIAREYGWVEGDHHRAWAIDQIVRKLTGDQYPEFVKRFCQGEDGPNTYEWDVGITP